MSPNASTFEIMIHHRFGIINEVSDLYGIYAPSNIRLGVNYGITNRIMVGFGTEKNNKLQELHLKYAILQQKDHGMPISLSYYGSVNLDAGPIEAYGQDPKFTYRLSYFNQLIAARKLTDKISFQVSGAYAHFNAVDSVRQNDVACVSYGAKYNFWNNMSILAEFDSPFTFKTIKYYQTRNYPNLGLGLEINTSTHNFQIFAANYSNIMNAKNVVFNKNDLTMGDFLLGFNITIRL
jgi:hypothetical protein